MNSFSHTFNDKLQSKCQTFFSSVVGALELKSGYPLFKVHSDRLIELFNDTPEFNYSTVLINSQSSASYQLGLLTTLLFNLKYFFVMLECSASLATCAIIQDIVLKRFGNVMGSTPFGNLLTLTSFSSKESLGDEMTVYRSYFGFHDYRF